MGLELIEEMFIFCYHDLVFMGMGDVGPLINLFILFDCVFVGKLS